MYKILISSAMLLCNGVNNDIMTWEGVIDKENVKLEYNLNSFSGDVSNFPLVLYSVSGKYKNYTSNYYSMTRVVFDRGICKNGGEFKMYFSDGSNNIVADEKYTIGSDRFVDNVVKRTCQKGKAYDNLIDM